MLYFKPQNIKFQHKNLPTMVDNLNAVVVFSPIKEKKIILLP